MHEPVHGGLSNDRIETKIARSWSRWRVSHRPGAALTKAKGAGAEKARGKTLRFLTVERRFLLAAAQAIGCRVGLKVFRPRCAIAALEGGPAGFAGATTSSRHRQAIAFTAKARDGRRRASVAAGNASHPGAAKTKPGERPPASPPNNG